MYLAELEFSATQIGVLIGVSAISSACSAFLHTILSKTWSSEKVLGVFIVVALIALSAMSLTDSYAVLAFMNITMGLAVGVTQPAMFSVLGAKISKNIQGLTVGLRTSSNRFATFLIPLFAGLIAGIFSTQWTFLIVGMVLLGLMLVTLWMARERL